MKTVNTCLLIRKPSSFAQMRKNAEKDRHAHEPQHFHGLRHHALPCPDQDIHFRFKERNRAGDGRCRKYCGIFIIMSGHLFPKSEHSMEPAD